MTLEQLIEMRDWAKEKTKSDAPLIILCRYMQLLESLNVIINLETSRIPNKCSGVSGGIVSILDIPQNNFNSVGC